MNYKNILGLLILTCPLLIQTKKMTCKQVALHKKDFDKTFKHFQKQKTVSAPIKHTLQHKITTTTTSWAIPSLTQPQSISIQPKESQNKKFWGHFLLCTGSKILDILDDPSLRLCAVTGTIAYVWYNKKK